MARLLVFAALLVPLTGCFPLFSWSSASSSDELEPPDEDDDWNDWDDDDDDVVLDWDETWMVSNLYDGQTAVSRDLVIELAVGYRDYSGDPDGDSDSADREWAELGFESIDLYPVGSPYDLVPLEFDIGDRFSQLYPARLDPDTTYVLDIVGLAPRMVVDRPWPGSIGFRTGSAPRVTGLWRVADTMIVAFSEPMDPDTLSIDHTSFDVWWETGGDLESIATDLNLADFAWQTDGELFRVAPLDLPGAVLVVLSGDVRAATGVPLDGDRDGVPGEADDDFFDLVEFGQLPECFTREDVPAPCVRPEEVLLDW